MISFRYHTVSLAAVFLALAVGVVLGSTALSDVLLSGVSGQRDQLAAQVSSLQNRSDLLGGEIANADRFAAGIGPLAVHGLLNGRTVVFISTADASTADLAALAELFGDAGAQIAGEIRLTSALTDPDRADQLRDLVTRLIPAGGRLPIDSDPGTLTGGLFGQLLLLNTADNSPQASVDERTAALAGLADGGFIVAGRQPVPAQLAIVVTGGAASGVDATDRAALIARFATAIRRSGAGAVLAGRMGSASGSGPIGVVRADEAANSVLSTVDDVDAAFGRIATVLALQEQAGGRSGSYGMAENARSPLPRLAAP